MTPETNRKKVVVFDRFDRNPNSDSHQTMDLNGEIDPDRHEVVAHANDLGRAAAILLAIKDGNIPLPDVIVLGSVLEGEADYEFNPHVMTTTKEKMVKKDKKKFFGLVTEPSYDMVLEEGRHIALPIVDDEGNVTLHSFKREQVPADSDYLVTLRDEHERLQHETARLKFETQKMNNDTDGLTGAGYTLSHLANHLLNTDGKKVKIIGHSSFPRSSFGKNAPLDAFVSKGSAPGTLRDEIDKVDDTGGSTTSR